MRLRRFGISPDSYHYASGPDDVKRVLRRAGLSVRSRNSGIKGKTVGAARKAIRKLNAPEGTFFYVGVPRHAMLLDHRGETVVDTAPVKRDVRKVQHCNIVEGLPALQAKRRETHRRIDLHLGIPAKFAGKTMGELTNEEADEFGRWLRAQRRAEAQGKKVVGWSRG